VGQQDAYRRHQVLQRRGTAIADPRGLAERWSSIAEVALRKDSQDRLELPLENASVRFVEATDGRGEGLGVVDIVVPDRARVLAAAAPRGRKVSDDQLKICGVRFNLR
jgi:hypothetical protein